MVPENLIGKIRIQNRILPFHYIAKDYQAWYAEIWYNKMIGILVSLGDICIKVHYDMRIRYGQARDTISLTVD